MVPNPKNGTAAPFTVDPVSGDKIFENALTFQTYARAAADEWQAARKTSVKETAGTHQPCLCIYKGGVYDVSEFVAAHPGGAAVLYEYNGMDISLTFHDEYNQHGHTDKALNMLLQYRIGKVKQVARAAADEEEEFEVYQLEELTAYPKMTKDEIIYKDFVIRRDRGLIWQSMFLTTPQYRHFIETPIYVPSCRLFDWAFMEPFSKTSVWVIPMLWLPLSLFWLARGIFQDNGAKYPNHRSIFDSYLYYPNNNLIFNNYPATATAGAAYVRPGATLAQVAQDQYQHALMESRFNPLFPLLAYGFGLFLWTLAEYTLHRFVFHFDVFVPEWIMDSPLAKLLHLVLHGIHHVIPMDPNRLVFPPALFVAASFIIYNSISYVIYGNLLDTIAGGIVLGYVCYDCIHYYIHHTEPQDFYFKDLKKYHRAHHYVDDTKGFGISNKLWDLVFKTDCKQNRG